MFGFGAFGQITFAQAPDPNEVVVTDRNAIANQQIGIGQSAGAVAPVETSATQSVLVGQIAVTSLPVEGSSASSIAVAQAAVITSEYHSSASQALEIGQGAQADLPISA